jgi:hypothetical protein
MKWLVTGLVFGLFAVSAWSQEPVAGEGAGGVAALPVQEVELELSDRSWFADTVATAVVRFPEVVETPESLPESSGGVAFVEVEVQELEEGEGSEAIIRWLPEREGVVVFPALEFDSGKTRFQNPATEIMVSAPQRTTEMSLVVAPGKKRVYAGEPLRLDVTWSCDVPAKRLRSMRCNPRFFSDAAIEVVIPRCTAPEGEQLGVPFGGRRVLARRKGGDESEVLGVVTFPLFLRFSEPGSHELPAVRIECARLKQDGGAFAPYAAFFNNGLFEPVDKGAAYDRVFVESGALEVEVLPLPESGRLESFSGLFLPCEITVSAKPAKSEVGQLLEVDLLVRSDAPHGFLELPDLGRQKSLRSWFKVDADPGRAWDREGTLFRARVRALTTRVKAFPSLEIEVFDPEAGDYAMLRTEAVPLSVLPREGRDYFDVKTLGMEEPSLSDQPEGIWQNAEAGRMDEAMNTLANFLADWFWLLLAAGPVMFVVLLPRARECRRRALNPEYRNRQRAYRAFRRVPEGTAEKWDAFRKFVAASLGGEPEAWTVGDARQRLADLGVSSDDIEMLARSQESLDAEWFSSEKKPASLPKLNPVAQRIAKFLGRSSVVVAACLLTGFALGGESDWDEAGVLFSEALEAEAGSDEAGPLFARSALKFEAAARARQHPGKAWFNAGNAWFQAGEIGRSIACQRQAEVYRPFDQTVRDNLNAARALAVDVVTGRKRSWWTRWPARWLTAALVPLSLGFWAALLGFVRWRRAAWLVGGGVLLMATLSVGGLAVLAGWKEGNEGVVVVSEVYGRKGPSYRYRTAFNEPLHDGLEFRLIEKRDGWIEIELVDRRRCWIPASQAQLVFRRG